MAPMERAKAGSTNDLGLSMPKEGSSRRFTAKIQMRISASQNDGVTWPMRPTPRATASIHVLGE